MMVKDSKDERANTARGFGEETAKNNTDTTTNTQQQGQATAAGTTDESNLTAEQRRQIEQRRQVQEGLDAQEEGRQMMAAQTKAREQREANAKKKQ